MFTLRSEWVTEREPGGPKQRVDAGGLTEVLTRQVIALYQVVITGNSKPRHLGECENGCDSECDDSITKQVETKDFVMLMA